jgi:hypothetical protein
VKKKPPACFDARTAVIALRTRRATHKPNNYTVVFPADWSKSQLLEYVRAVHPEDTARIVKWNEAYTVNDEVRLWMVNPRAFSNFKKGILK